jgi:serine/threonine protein phosphatase PrpC
MSESANNSEAQTASAMTGISVHVFGRTDVGLVREHNEDNFIIADLTNQNRSIKPEVREHSIGPQGSLFAVCDGMGGAAAGEVASQIAVDTIYEQMQDGEAPQDDEALARKLDGAIIEAGERIYTAARVNRGRRGMGTTVTAAVLIGPRLIIGQVGDSRAYIYRRGRFVQLTKDQSLVQQLIDANQLTEEEARDFDKNNIILQALGTSESVHVDMTSAILRRGDRLVMCSDGLCGLVSDDEITKVIEEAEDPMESCRQLTDIARDAGGHDNITVIVVLFDGDELLAPSSSGDDLGYNKYEYSSGRDITARASNPLLMNRDTRPPPKEMKPQDPEKENEKIGEQVPEKQKIQTGLLAAAVAALLVGIALIVYIVTLNSQSDGTGVGETVSPSGDDVAPVESDTDTLKDGSESRRVVGPAKVEADRLGLDKSGEPDMDDAPSLAPTPEGAIIGRSDRSGLAGAGKKGVGRKGLKAGSSRDTEGKKTEERTEIQAEQESGERKEAVPEKVAEKKKDIADKKAVTDKQVESQKKAPSKKSSPKKLDDNPF